MIFYFAPEGTCYCAIFNNKLSPKLGFHFTICAADTAAGCAVLVSAAVPAVMETLSSGDCGGLRHSVCGARKAELCSTFLGRYGTADKQKFLLLVCNISSKFQFALKTRLPLNSVCFGRRTILGRKIERKIHTL